MFDPSNNGEDLSFHKQYSNVILRAWQEPKDVLMILFDQTKYSIFDSEMKLVFLNKGCWCANRLHV